MSIERMDSQISVFNLHVNDAGKRALKVMEDNFPDFYKEIKKEYDEGIMSIFNYEPTLATGMFCALVTAFVNKY